MIALSAADCSVTKGQHRKVVAGMGSYRKVVPNHVFHLESGVALVMSKIPDRMVMVAAAALVRRLPGDDDDEDEDDEKHPEEDEDEGDDEDGYSE
jgi:hypothetical protein